ncbi:hypothetical protein FB45DRAFT_1053749 [Roridomyces roridus]|uniref:F-box domain-containing protein n=1 Tax=Roridomyces roridus TaxID=1738132 RepID=A0AAD7C7C8_9AGAR|nr:hypothetical protein FB45DRAFT_1053749 [Roridomyces roridus]
MSTSSNFVPAAARARLAQLATQHPLTDSILLERETLQQALVNYKYPVLTLPSEITSGIFLQFLPSYPERAVFIGPCSPSLLLQVCREWRDVALATPELWSTFKVPVMGYRDTLAVHARNQRLLVEWLERSKDCPLSVELWCVNRALLGAAAPIELLDTLVRHSKRWQDMKLVFLYQHLDRIAGSLPMIRDLHLVVQETWSSDGTKLSPPQNFALHTPNLRELGLQPGLNFDTFKSVVPWSQITVFSGDLDEHDAAQVLRSAGALEECSMMVQGRAMSEYVLPIPPLHHLKSLTLKSSLVSPGSAMLAKALLKALPALEILDVKEPLLGAEDPVGTLSLLCPPGYTGRLKVCDARTAAAVYEAAFPNVEELVVEQWVRRLSYDGRCPCCWDDSDDDSDSESE